MVVFPACPPGASPVDRVIEPVLPTSDTPVRRDMVPLEDPVPRPALEVDMSTFPLLDEGEDPLFMNTEPP
jgi:hypothetical protein